MIKLTTVVKRKLGLTYEEFDTYWREHHSLLVDSVKEDLAIIRYVQTVPLLDKTLNEAMRSSRNSLYFDYEGMAEIWWQSLEEMNRHRSTEQGLRAIKLLSEDESSFVEQSQSLIWYSSERNIIY